MRSASHDYRGYDIEAGRPSSRASSDENSRYNGGYPLSSFPPSMIHHPADGKLPVPDDTATSSACDERSHKTNSSSGSGKLLKKHFSKFFRFPTTTRGDERRSLVGRNHHQQHDLTSAGTFDTQTTTLSGAGADHHYEHPRSQKKMNEKWGNIRQQMNPDQWIRSLESAKRMGFPGEDGMDREELLRNAQEKIRSLTQFNLWHCLAAILVYVAISVACFSYWLEEDWTVVDSIYFSVVTFTTIGYGDIVPDTRMARLFTCAWALSGVACLGIALGVLGSELIDVAEQDKKKAKEKRKADMIDMFNNDDTVASTAASSNQYSRHRNDDGTISQWSDLGNQGVEDDDDDDVRDSSCCQTLFSNKVQRFLLLFIFLVLTLHFISIEEGWTVWTTLYYGIITGRCSTVKFYRLVFLSCMPSYKGCCVPEFSNIYNSLSLSLSLLLLHYSVYCRLW